ncbi:hypothetical protein [Mycolicibacterium lutetiense]|uniref:Ribosomal silencing factor RsfS n=1 Tax=Mycolicibacterium lutetiense TaxID=1641992 RepID=A0ABS4ZQM6_9MYCO|nr:hypothetical protein [Mycolicibacterium lutetiense]MBP2451802.1 ribosomal silencing factor RsfS [Mycolicibacterium lutetiense]
MCRTAKRRCPHNPQRDRERRAAMKTYRADLASAAAQFAGPGVLSVIAAAPASALAPIATDLGLDPATVSSVSPSTHVTHDISGALRGLAAAKAADAGHVPSEHTLRRAAILNYEHFRGYEPLHPLFVGVIAPPRELDDLRTSYAKVHEHTASDGLGAGNARLTVSELGAIEADRARRRQEIADLFVAETRQDRADAGDSEQWSEWLAAEQNSITTTETVSNTAPTRKTSTERQTAPQISFHTADGFEENIDPATATHIAAAYTRLSGNDVDIRFFATHSDAVLAHGVHIGRCDTPAEAIGEVNWKAYLTRADGDERKAREAVATDIETVFSSSDVAAFATRASHRRALKVSEAVETAARRWEEDTDAAWKVFPSSGPVRHQVILDRLLRPRHLIGDDPFDLYDGVATYSSGGVYLPESNVVEAMVTHVKMLHQHHDLRMQAVADAIIDRARAARDLPTGSFAERIERQWQLVELADAAELLTEDPDHIEDVTLLTANDPNQMELFALDAAA